MVVHPLHDHYKSMWEKFHEDGYNLFSERIVFYHIFNLCLPYLDRDANVLDIGCGTGDMFDNIQTHIGKYNGIDISKNVCKKLFNRFQNHVKLGTILDCPGDGFIPFPDKEFDIITSCLAFQHIHPKYFLNYLKQSRRVLKDNGLIMFHFTVRDEYIHNKVFLDDWNTPLISKIPNNISEKVIEYMINGFFSHDKDFLFEHLQENKFKILSYTEHTHDDLIKDKAKWTFVIARKQ